MIWETRESKVHIFDPPPLWASEHLNESRSLHSTISLPLTPPSNTEPDAYLLNTLSQFVSFTLPVSRTSYDITSVPLVVVIT